MRRLGSHIFCGYQKVNHALGYCMRICINLVHSSSQCQQHIEEMKADACAQSVMDKDARKFWHDVYRLSNAKATTNVITVGGKIGDTEIAEMWKKHYEQLYCAKYNEDHLLSS